MDNFIDECKKAPRINVMVNFFSTTASGDGHVPSRYVDVDLSLFKGSDIVSFSHELTKNSGPFVNRKPFIKHMVYFG